MLIEINSIIGCKGKRYNYLFRAQNKFGGNMFRALNVFSRNLFRALNKFDQYSWNKSLWECMAREHSNQ